ncbi:MAG: AI-2E family transporter [Actinomycetota bacterium]|nr:AI-2E family transporter [Actinomycetota bacterium]
MTEQVDADASAKQSRSPFVLGFVCTLAALTVFVLARSLLLVRGVLLLFVTAAVLAVGLDLVVQFLQRRGWRRGWAVAVVLLGLAVVVGAIAAVLVPVVVSQVSHLVARSPELVRDVRKNNTGALGQLDRRFHIADTLARKQPDVAAFITPGTVLVVVRTALGVAGAMLTMFALTIYLVIEMPSVKGALYRLYPRSRRARAALLTDEILRRTGGFILGNLLTSAVAGVGTAAWALALGIPFALALGLFVAIADLIPVVGSTLAGIVVALVALSVSLPVAVATVVFFIVYRLFEDYLLSPRVMRRTVDVSPITTIVALLMGGALLGIVGALLAIPVAAAVQLIMSEVVRPRLDET